jgi:hypothetical protein
MKVCSKCKIEKSYDEFYNDKKTKSGKKSYCKKCTLKNLKNWKEENNQKIKEQKKRYYYKNTEKVNQYFKKYQKNKRELDPVYRMICSLRVRVGHFCRSIIKNKNLSATKSIGLNRDDFRKYIESKFKDGMTWDNYGEWHIDHIKPLSLATSEEEAMQLNYYTNLQPLWAEDNKKKSNKYE